MPRQARQASGTDDGWCLKADGRCKNYSVVTSETSAAYVNGVSEAIFKVGMCLPAGPYVTDDDVRYIVDTIKANIIGWSFWKPFGNSVRICLFLSGGASDVRRMMSEVWCNDKSVMELLVWKRIRAFLRSFLYSGATRRSRFASRSNRLSRLVNPRTSNSDMAACRFLEMA